MEKVSSILARHLKKWGVTHVFGIPGKPVVPLLLELDEQEIQFVLSRHECGAGYEAAGYSQLRNTIGVAIGTSGPGGTNLITAAGQAKASHIPVVFITGHLSIKDMGKALGQDSTQFGTDLVEMFKPVTKFSGRIERGDQVITYLKHALEKALSGVKGPVHLSIPADVLMEEIESFDLELPEPASVISPRYYDVIDLLNSAKRPLMFLGKGVHSSKAYEEVKMMAEMWNIPVMTTPGGKGAFQSHHELSLGAFGLGGTEEADQYVQQGVDVMLVMGSKLSDMSLAGLTREHYPEKVIHFDYDQTFVGKTLNVPTLFIAGDLKRNLQFILGEMLRRGKMVDSNRYPLQEPETTWFTKNYEKDQALSTTACIQLMNEILPSNTIIFGDAGSHSYYAIKHLSIKKPGSFFFDDVYGAMGNAIGFSIGAKLAAPNQNIICLTGDGCVLMHGAEISTAVNADAAVIFIIINNQGLDMVDKGMKAHVGKSVGTTYSQPVDLFQYANSLGAYALKCKTMLEFQQSLLFALSSNRTTVIEAMVDPDEMPPTLRRG